MSRTIFYGPKDVPVIEVRLYFPEVEKNSMSSLKHSIYQYKIPFLIYA